MAKQGNVALSAETTTGDTPVAIPAHLAHDLIDFVQSVKAQWGDDYLFTKFGHSEDAPILVGSLQTALAVTADATRSFPSYTQWATGCSSCDDYPTQWRDEDEARERAVGLQAAENQYDDPHTIVVLTRAVEHWHPAAGSTHRGDS